MTKADFPEFYLIWDQYLNRQTPDFHLDVCAWMDNLATDRDNLLMLPRGHNKSGILDVYNAYRYYKNSEDLILHQGANDTDAYKVSRGTQNVLSRHPLTAPFGVIKASGEVQKWWVAGSSDVRYGSMYARGILSTVTGQRATLIQNDDVEVPSNVATPEAREKLRYRLSEQTHILIPGSPKLWVGTPHSHDSLYKQLKEKGANCFIRRMFEHEARFENVRAGQILKLTFRPEYIFSGIGKGSKLLSEDNDYKVNQNTQGFSVELRAEYHLVDCYSGALWPERFTSQEMKKRRVECNTINEWDSQYQLHAKPVGEVRLNPDYLKAYNCEPVFHKANGELVLMLGDRRISSATLHFDPSSGKLKSDKSAVSLLLQDELGILYWHRSKALIGAIAEFDEKGRVNGGQVWQLCDIIEEFKLGRVVVETNGVGTHVPANIKGALKARGLRCGVTEVHQSAAKNRRILGAIEAPLTSGYLYAHISVLEDENGEDSDQVKQMRQFNPAIIEQEDDYIDALAGSISDEPVRVGKIHGKHNAEPLDNWRTVGGTYEATLDF